MKSVRQEAPNYEWLFIVLFLLSFSVWHLRPTHCRCRGLSLHLITLNDTHTVGLLWTRGRPTSWNDFLRRFRKITTIRFVMSVCPPIRMEQLGSYWTDFYEIWYLRILRKFIEKDQVSLQYDKNSGYCTWSPRYIYDNISVNSSQDEKCFRQICGENQNTHFMFNN